MTNPCAPVISVFLRPVHTRRRRCVQQPTFSPIKLQFVSLQTTAQSPTLLFPSLGFAERGEEVIYISLSSGSFLSPEVKHNSPPSATQTIISGFLPREAQAILDSKSLSPQASVSSASSARTTSKGIQAKDIQVKLYVHYTNNILYVHYTNIKTPPSPINLSLYHYIYRISHKIIIFQKIIRQKCCSLK